MPMTYISDTLYVQLVSIQKFALRRAHVGFADQLLGRIADPATNPTSHVAPTFDRDSAPPIDAYGIAASGGDG